MSLANLQKAIDEFEEMTRDGRIRPIVDVPVFPKWILDEMEAMEKDKDDSRPERPSRK